VKTFLELFIMQAAEAELEQQVLEFQEELAVTAEAQQETTQQFPMAQLILAEAAEQLEEAIMLVLVVLELLL
jgi:hypothetical protein